MELNVGLVARNRNNTHVRCVVTSTSVRKISLKILIGVICLFLLSVNSWSACSSANQFGSRLTSYYNGPGGAYRCDSYSSINYYQMCNDYPSSLCPPKFVYNGKFYAQPVVRIDGYGVTANCPNSNKCAPRTSATTYDVGCYYTLECTETEVDSLNCVNAGNNWQNGSCKSCTQPDSTWGECATIYKYSQQYGSTIPVTQVRKYERKDCEEREISRETFEGKTCDNLFTPESSEVKCYATMGTTVYLQNGLNQVWACKDSDGSCEYAQKKYMDGECPPPDLKSSSSTEEPPSGGGDVSSSSTQPSSSAGEDYSSGLMPNDLEFIKDSFYMVDTNLKYLRNDVEYLGADVKHIASTNDDLLLNNYTQNQLLRDIANKDWNINVNNPRDTVINNIHVSGGEAYNDSNVTDRLDSIIGKLNSNNEQADTSGVGGSLQSLQGQIDELGKQVDSAGVRASFWNECDTTGGKDCSDNFIGKNGLDSAKSGISQAYKTLGDSLKNGPIGDSLKKITDAISNNTVLQGKGSDNCPEPLSRSYELTIAEGVSGQLSFGRYVCTPLLGGYTPWSIGRMLLRTLVAIGCMWWIFKQATGTGEEG